MSQLILEAFRELKGLEEDVFSFDKQGALELKDFLHADRKEPTEVEVIDPDATTEQDLQDNYDGEVILSCCACHGLISKSPKEVVIDPDTQRANVDEPCPNCFNKVGYRVMAQIPSDGYQPEEEEVDQTEEHSDDTLEIDTDNITVEEADQESDQIEESMKKPITKAAGVIPAPFDKYYQVASEEDSKALSEDDIDEVQWFKDEFDVDFIGWLTAKDQYRDALGQDGYEVAALYINNGTPEVGEIVGGRLFTLDFAEDVQPLVECDQSLIEKKLKINKDDDIPDLWDKVYAALGENGEQIKNPNSKRGTYRFNIGAGYGYERLSVDGDGNIVIRAASEEELEPAKAAVESFADQGVTYEIKVSKHDKKRPYAIVVSIPVEEIAGIDECAKKRSIAEEVKSGDFNIYYRDGEDSDWEHYDIVRNVADLNSYMDKFAEWLDDDSTPHWEYDEDTCIISDGYGQEYRFEAVNDSLTESIENITVETNDDTITVRPSEGGKVSIDTEPKTADPGALEPVSPEVQAEIESNGGEAEEESAVDVDVDVSADLSNDQAEDEEDVDITDFDETQFDDLGESYLKKVYENVNSFKTTRGYIDNNKIKLEGIIKFNSGKQAKTSFLFEGYNVTKRGKYKLIGENIQITNRKNAFILTGDIKEGSFLPEALTYNYNAKDATTGKSKKVYGTVRSKK